MSAISFGLAATAILVSMFLVMALVEHLIIPRVSLIRSRNSARDSPPEVRRPSPAPVQSHQKGRSSLAVTVGNPHAREVFVVMPGEEHPTFLAQLVPLPSPREGTRWPPSHYASVACM
ncbi:uncharacterized protein LOC141812865 [Curcuma longa]|uniref:uncharacterized protein LOC141812865 n=1 Tax=Curcuma longa TaxID=136217 RepID=UPI003D9EEE04